MSIITVLTDFGVKDPYVAVMKAVMLDLDPRLRFVDVTHEVDPQDVGEASFLVEEYYPYFPRGTVHLCVVDPTVGSARKPLVVRRAGHLFVGPDNGLFSLLFLKGDATAHEITERRFMRESVGGTFHGRDVFAPAAARLAAGVDPRDFGPPVAQPVVLPDLFPVVRGDVMEGRIVRFDRFGNAVSNVAYESFRAFTGERPFGVRLSGLSFDTVVRSYYEAAHTCLVGSSGYLEFGMRGGDLKREMGLGKGEKVLIRRGSPPVSS